MDILSTGTILPRINDGHSAPQMDENTTTPVTPTTPKRRASYLSPTKASLSRSHPDILNKSPARALTEPRGKILRQQLLGKRPREEDSHPPVPKTAPKASHIEVIQSRNPKTDIAGSRDGFAAAIAQAFNAAPGRAGEPQQENSARRTPLSTRQPRNLPNTSRSRHGSETVAQEFILPKLVRRSESDSREASGALDDELELPPTPVQLGLDLPPARPRGLAGSSSAGSRSGSGRHRRRLRGSTNNNTSSPLKPRTHGPIQSPSLSETEEMEAPVEEAPESDTEQVEDERASPADQSHEVLGPAIAGEIEEKQSVLLNLQADLERLRKDLGKLEGLMGALETDASTSVDDATLNILCASGLPRSREFGLTGADPESAEERSAYTNLFAPGNLQLSHTTTTRRLQSRPKTIHKLTVAAPPPWASGHFQLSFDVTVDAEDARVDKVVQVKPGQFWMHNNLQTWIEGRLQDPLHQRDVGGIIWGTGKYMEESIKRARVMYALSDKYNDGKRSMPRAELDSDKVTTQDAQAMSRFLDTNQLVLKSDATASRDLTALGVLLIYDLHLDWAGTVRPSVHISVTGVNARAQKSAKELFQKLVASQGVIGALDKVWQLLGSQSPDSGGS